TYGATDSAGNTYAVNIQGAKAVIVRTVILSAHNVQALVSGNTITVTHPSLPGTAKRGLSADEFSGLAKTGTFDQSQTGFNSGAATTAADSGATATTTQAAELLMGAIGDDGPLNDGFTAGDNGQGGTYTVNASSRAGNSGSCPADAVKTADTVCRAAGDVCDKAETCDGSSTACPPDAKQPATTPCTADSNPCTLDQCDGTSNACQHPAGNAGAACAADGNPCTLDQCNATSTTCQHPAGNARAVCRASAGE